MAVDEVRAFQHRWTRRGSGVGGKVEEMLGACLRSVGDTQVRLAALPSFPCSPGLPSPCVFLRPTAYNLCQGSRLKLGQ